MWLGVRRAPQSWYTWCDWIIIIQDVIASSWEITAEPSRWNKSEWFRLEPPSSANYADVRAGSHPLGRQKQGGWVRRPEQQAVAGARTARPSAPSALHAGRSRHHFCPPLFQHLPDDWLTCRADAIFLRWGSVGINCTIIHTSPVVIVFAVWQSPWSFFHVCGSLS